MLERRDEVSGCMPCRHHGAGDVEIANPLWRWGAQCFLYLLRAEQ